MKKVTVVGAGKYGSMTALRIAEYDIVQEVARRVAARLLREKKQEDVATKLAERIFRRLAGGGGRPSA